MGKGYALRSFCGVVASSGVDTAVVDESSSEGKMLNERLLNKLLEALLKSRSCFTATSTPSNKEGEEEEEELLITDEALLSLLESEFIRPYRDVQYFVLKGVNRIALDLVGSLEREEKDLTLRKTAKKKKEEEEEHCTESGYNSEGSAKKVGLVAENMCRLLMMMDYVAKSKSDLQDDGVFLFPPPVLSLEDADEAGEDEQQMDGDQVEDEDSEASSDSSDESDDDEDTNKNKNGKKRMLSSKANQSSKRSKKNKSMTWQQPYKHRNALQEAWLSTLRLPNLPPRTQKRVLQHLSTYVLGVCPSPLRFAEYFTRSFHNGSVVVTDSSSSIANSNNNNGLTAILSLHGLFILMLDHQLEYPQFYTSLYQLLHPRILYTKHRTRFLRLLSKSLSGNSMLPAYVVASFCKKLCRLALVGPPSGGLFVLALVSNLLRKHGECACLIHRKGNPEDGLMEDVYVEEVDDLVKTRALESSLWELDALVKHYHPAISALAKSCGTEDDKTPLYDMEDFMAHTYKSLFEQEKKRVGGDDKASGKGNNFDGGKGSKGGMKGKVSLTFVEPKGLFGEDDVFGCMFKCS